VAATFIVVACVASAVVAGAAVHLSEPPMPTVAQVRAALKAAVTFQPAPGATGVAPDAKIVVHGGSGRLVAARATAQDGTQIVGQLSHRENAWHSHGALAYGAHITVTATVVGPTHARVDSTMSFGTLTPAVLVDATMFPTTGLEVGVGEPIQFRLSRPITSDAARRSLLSHLTVSESRPVAGGWRWFSDTELHFRPKAFWPAGEHITVTWDFRGWNAGGGAWGSAQGSTAFNIGDARVSYANLATDVMSVTDNGRVVAIYPISGGKPTDPTMGGVHVVLDRESVVHMVSSTNGIPVDSPDGYDELVYSDVHISDSGEYVHAAPWSVTSQGRTNVSHGCVNLSPADAAAFFAFSRVGDVVLVAGSPRPPDAGDHGVMDWTASWSSFSPAR
jgi:lipoprotein-anchoring transpeptidase ErfK/SrfK